MDEFQHLEHTLRATKPYMANIAKVTTTMRRESKVGRLDTHHDGLRFAKHVNRSGTH